MKNLFIYDYLEKSIKDHIKEDMIVYVIPQGNSMRGRSISPYELMEEYKVIKVGRKYFKAINPEKDIVMQFEAYCGYIKDKSDYSAERKVFLTKLDFEFEKFMYNMHEDRESRNELFERYKKLFQEKPW